MPSFFSYLSKEQQKVFRGIPYWTASNFNTFMKDNESAISVAELDPVWFDQVITKLAEKTYNTSHLCSVKPKGWALPNGYPRPFSRELCEDLLHLMIAVKKAQAHEAKVQQITAAAKGLVKYEDVKTKFPFICTWEPKGYHVKLQLWRDIDPVTKGPRVVDGTRYYIKTFVWLDKKEWYSEDEIKDACNEIIKKERSFIQLRIEQLDSLESFVDGEITGGFVL